MLETRRDMANAREKKDKQLEEEKQRQMTRQWWRQPASSSTMTWVHSGGARGTTQGEVREWTDSANESMAGQANNTTVNLETTLEEMEVLDLDQTLTMDLDTEADVRERDGTSRGMDSKGEKTKTGKGQ